MMPLVANAFFSPYMMSDMLDWHVPMYTSRSYEVAPRPSSTTTSWLSTKDAYVMRLRVPELEPESVEATLQADEAFLTLSGKKKLDGCECAKRVVETVPLPYRPRAEDIQIELDKNKNVLELRLARKAKATAPIALSVKLAGQQEAAASDAQTRPIRFIPHASASATTGTATTADEDVAKAKAASTSLEERERSLTAKFAAALSTSSKAAKEATSNEAAAAKAAEATTTTVEAKAASAEGESA